MIRSLLKRCRNFYGIFVILTASLFFSCQIGLGETVDTQPPEISFMESDNDPVSNAVIRGAFTLRGAWKDDGKIQEVNITISSNSLGKSAKLNGTIIENESKGEGVWQALVNPKDLDLTDGTYDVSVTVKDGSGHITEITRSYIIDNTAPVLILSRPSSTQTSEDNKIESYGQYLTFEGQAADDNDVKALVINFYSKNEPETLLYSKEINNIPPTISLDVATFLDNDAYTAIYGNEKQGEKPYYCTVTAYDGARKYSLPGEESNEDDKGNAEASYILWTDWEKASSEAGVSLKVPDLYHIKSGSYFTSASRAADVEKITNMWSSLMEKTVSLSSFKLNPENSPTYSISGLSVGIETNVENDSSLTVQLAKGLDGISLEIESMKVYLLACDANANALEGAERLYPVESTYYQKGDGQFLTKIAKNKFVNAAGTGVNLVYGQTYIIGVEGKDISGNTIMPSFDGKKFIIRFKAKMIAPEVSIESPADTISYLKKGATLTIKGTASVPDGYPVLKIKCKKGAADSEVIYTHNFTDADKVNATENMLTYGFQFTVNADGSGDYSFDQNTSTQYVFDIITSLDDMSTAYTKTVLYDVEAPGVDIESILPTASKYSDNEEIEQPTGQYLNGSVTMKVSVIDAYDTVDTEKSYWSVISSKSPEASAEKHKFTTPAKEAFVIDTKAIAGTEEITIKIYAQDRAGNGTLYERKYNVDQTTDIPLIRPYIPKAVTLKYASSEEITAAITNKISKSILTTGSPLQIKIIDDDGIKSCSFKISDKDTGLNLREPTEIDQSITGSPVEYIFSYTLPTVPGRYKCSLTVTDIHNNTMPAKEFWILVTGPAPVVTISSTTPQNKIVTLSSGTLTANAQKQITNTVSIDSGYDSFIVKRQEQGCAEVTLYGSTDENRLHSHEFTDTFTPSASRTANKVIYTVIDENNHSGDRIFEYFVDSTAPVIDQTTISVPDNKQTESVSFRFTGTANDTSETNIGNTTSSGVIKLQYTFDESQAVASARSGDVDTNHPDHIVDVANVTSLSENVYFSATEYDYAFGTGKEGEKKIFIRAIDAVGNIGSWVSKSFMYDKANPVVTIKSYTRENETENLITSTSKTFDSGKLFSLSGSAEDSQGIKTFQIWQKKEGQTGNGIKLVDIDNKANGNWSIDHLPRAEDGTVQTESEIQSGRYTYTVIAIDKSAFERQEAKSTEEKVTVIIDRTPPVLVVSDLADGEAFGVDSLSGNSYTFRGTLTDGDGTGSDVVYYAFTTSDVQPDIPFIKSVTVTGNDKWNIPRLLGTTEDDSASAVDTDDTLCEGKKYLWLYGVDKAGNTTLVKNSNGDFVATKISFMVDQNKPRVSYKVYRNEETTNPQLAENSIIKLNRALFPELESNTNFVPKYTIRGTAWDANGIENIKVYTQRGSADAELEAAVQPDENGKWSVTVTGEGNNVHTIYAYDKSGNATKVAKVGSPEKSCTIIFDTTPPANVDIKDYDDNQAIIETETIKRKWLTGIGDNYINGTAEDNESGLSEISIIIDDPDNTNHDNWTKLNSLSEEWTYKFKIPSSNFTENNGSDGSYHTVTVKAVDKAGNETKKTKYFRYDKEKPTISFEGNSNPGVNSSRNSDFTFTVKAKDSNKVAKVEVLYGSQILEATRDSGDEKEGLYSKTFTVGEAGTLADGTYDFTIRVSDIANNTAEVNRTLTIDTIDPSIEQVLINNDAVTNRENPSGWYNSQSIPLAVTTRDNVGGSGDCIVEYQTLKDSESSLGEWKTLSDSALFRGAGAGQKLYIRVKDAAGNVAYFKTVSATDKSPLPVLLNIDTSAPTIGNTFYYKLEGETEVSQSAGQIYVNGSKDLIIYGSASDPQSGLSSLSFKIGDTSISPSIEYATTGTDDTMASQTYSASPSDRKAIKYWKATIAKGLIDSKAECGILKITATNGAVGADGVGSSSPETTVLNITYDRTNPLPVFNTFSSSNIKKQPYKKGSEYYVNNTDGNPKFTISGIASDNCGVKDVTLTIGTLSIPRTSESLTEWVFGDIDLSSYTGTPIVKVTVTDVAGNIGESTFTLNFDITGPKAKHWADSNNKDIYFRIGNGVGNKYAFGTYGKDSSMEIRGTFEENGSGLKAVYYKLYDSVPDSIAISNFENGTVSADGNIAVVNETQTVPYNSNSASESVTSNFHGQIQVFSNEQTNRYLILVAEDNVGNRAADKLEINGGPSSVASNENWNSAEHTSGAQKKYYSLNKDTTPPTISGSITAGAYTKGTGNLVLEGTVSDAASGVKSVTVRIDDGQEFTADLNNGRWTKTIPISTFVNDSTTSGTFTAYATATDNAGEGNSKQISVGTITVDRENPKFENIRFTETEGSGTSATTKDVYTKTDNTNGSRYYVKNDSRTKTFKISGFATDNFGVEKVELEITDTTANSTLKLEKQTKSGNDIKGNCEFAIGDWKGWISALTATATITVTDKAGNTKTESLDIVFDRAAPIATHQTDNEGKDIYFRIGDQNNDSIISAADRDVGGKYKAGTYSDSNTIKIRGSFADAEGGSGINYIYYKVFQIPSTLPSGITTSEAYITSIRNSFVSNYETEKTGLITPLRTPENRRVFYTGNVLTGGTAVDSNADATTGRYYKEIGSDYKATLSGFETGNNYILILAVDKVGNVTFEEQTFQINYDDTAPTITEKNSGDFNKTYIVNAQGKDSKGEALTISGKVKDDRAGLRSFVIKVNDTVIDSSNIKYETNVTSLPTGDTTEHTWTATIPASILNAQTSAIAVYAEAVDDAGSGHSVNRKVGSVQIDNTVPSIRVTSTAGWIKNSISNASVYVNDANGLKTHSVSETNTNRGAETVEKEYVSYYVYASDDFENGVPKSTATLLVNGTVDVGNGGVAAISTIDTSNIEAFVNGKAYIIRFEAEDIVGNKSYVNTENYNVDRTGPTLDSTVSGVKDSVTDKKGTDVGADDTWYNAETLTVYGMFNDKAGFETTEIEGSGVASINYTIVRPSSTNLENITGTWLTADGSYSASLAGFKDGINILQLNAEDNLGNPSTTGRSFTVKVDTVKPVISEVHENDFKTVTLTNGSESRKFEFDVSDSGSGITTSAASVTVKAGSRTISNGTNGSSITVGEAAENGKKRVTVILGPADLSAISGNNSVLVTVKDKANNESLSQSIGTLNVDKDKPEVEVTSHTNGETVNKTITISGKVTDPSNSAIRSVYLTAETGAITRFFAYTTSVWNANTDYSLNDIVKDNASNKYYKCKADHTSGTTFETDKTDKWDEINSITYANGQWTASLDTRDFNNTTSAANLELSLTATDAAGNTSNNPEELTLSIDQNTDRPVISFTNLPWAAGTGAAGAVKEYNKNLKILSGIISDDDGSIQELRIAVADTCPSDFSSVSAITVNSTGAFSIDLGDDGTKKLWLYVKDKKNGVFVTGAAEGQLKQPYLLFSGNSEKKDDSTATTFKINNTSPTITASGFAYGQTENTVGSEYGEFTSTSYAGGSSESVRRYVRFKIIARTSIDVPVASVKVSVGGIDNPIEFQETGKLQEGNTETWYSAPIDVTAWTHGSHTLTFTVEDASGLFAISEPKQIMIDKVGPSVSLISPRGEEVTSPVSLVGTSTDEHTVEKIGFVVADNRYYSSAGVLNANADTQIKAAAKLAADTNKRTGTESAWQFVLNGQTDADGKVNPSLPTNEGSEEGGIENVTTGISLAPVPDGYGNESDTRNLTLVLYACDELGNETWTYKNILYNPFADRPMAAVTYPLGSWLNAANVADYSVLNGSIRVTGSAQDNVSMTPNGKVFVQLDLNNDGEFDSEDLELLETLKKSSTDISPIYSVAAGNLVKGAGSIQGQTNLEALGDAEKQAAFWGIPVKGTNSWSITINSYNELKQLTSASIGTGEYKIGIRAVAMDNTGVFGTWGAKQYFKIDQNVPSIGDAEIIATDENGNVISAQVAEKYEQDMYLSGNKKLKLYISDNEGLESVNYIYASSLEGLNSSSYNGTIEKTTLDANKPSGKDEYGMYKYSVDIPLSSLISTVNSKTVALKVTAKKKDDAAETYERYLVHFDDEAPEIKNLTLNSVEHSGSANASENKVVNSNLIFTLGGRSEDLGAGFARMSFYFIREPRQGTTGTEKRLYDVIDASKESIPVSGLDTQVVTVGSGANARTFTIYGKEQTSITVSNNGLSLAGYDTDPHVHAGGYVLIGSKWHKIESISGNTVNLTTATNASGTTSVFFAYLQTIDNTSTERRDDNNELLITGDDGDGLCESIIKSQTKWDYDVSFDSRNIPDGPGKFVVFVYDKAGNVSAKEYAVSVQNNAPRLTKLWLATDLSGDGKFQDIASEGITELVEYNVLSKVGEQTNYKDMNTVDYRGENFIIKNKLAVIPEFTGGNGAIKMALNNNAATSTAITSYETDAAAAAAGALYISQGATAVPDIASFTLARSEDTTWAYVIDNDTLRPSSPAENRAMSFTFWDSTEETAPGVDSNWCYLRIKDLRVNVDDVTDPKVVVNPFKWDSKNNNSLYKNSSENGHIELEADLSETVFTATSGLMDRDPKVSGKITIRGTAFDDYTLSSIWVAFDEFTPATGTYTATKTLDSLTYYKLASYTNGSWVCSSPSDTATVNGTTWAFKVTNNYIRASGHKASWQLDIDTAGITGRMGLDKNVYVRAIDATGDVAGAAETVVTAHTSNLTATGTADSEDSVYSKPTYRMDIVPYITKVLDENSNTATRSRLGRYPVRMGKEIYLEGFNFGDGTLSVKRHKTVNGIASTTAETDSLTATRVTGDNNKIQITAVPNFSGFLNLTITPTGGTALTAINNSNSASAYNIQKGYDAEEEDNAGNKTYGRLTANRNGTDFWADDIYLSVWNVAEESQFNGSINPHSGVIKKVTTQNSGSGAPNNTSPGTNGHVTAAEGPGGGYLYKQSGQNKDVPPVTDMNDSYYAAISSDDLKLYGYVSGRNYTTLGHGDNIAFASSEVAYVAPVDEMDYTIVNGMPYYVFQDNGLGGDSGSVWGLGLVMMREGIWYDRGYFNPYKYNTIEEAKLPYFVERQGYNKASWQRDSSGGYDSILYQFKNPRIAGWYNANDSLLYTKQGGNKYIDGVDYIYISYYDSYAKCLKYAAYKVGHRFATNDHKFANTDLKDWGKVDVDHDIDIVAKMSSSPNTAGNQPDQTTYNHMTDGASVVAGNDTTSNNPSPTVVAGEWSDIFVDSTGASPIPVIIYYNMTAKSLEIARGNNSFPQATSEWTKTLAIRPTGVSSDFGRYVSAAMDTAGNLHVAAQDADNSILYYLYLTKTGDTYTVSKSIAVDGSSGAGRWTDIELTNPAETSLAAIAPVISYIDTSFMGTTKGIKVAYLVGTEPDGTPIFEAMTDPARYAPNDQRTSVMADVKETKSSTTKATVGVGFNSDKLALDFLRDE